MLAHLPGFLAVSIVVILLPGPDTAVVTRNALRDGLRGGVATSVGVVAGLFVWTLTASLGVAALLRASAPAFFALKVVGACYLAYLGARTLWDAFRNRSRAAQAQESVRRTPTHVSLRQGLLSDLGNPKIAVFFTSFLPQFVPAGAQPLIRLEVLGLVFCAITLAWLLVYSVLVARTGDLLRTGRMRRALDAVTGVVLVGLGGRLALERR
jgi:threonine/homoserine/homoserine lactone efflux protein